jgi:hypothetical protein
MRALCVLAGAALFLGFPVAASARPASKPSPPRVKVVVKRSAPAVVHSSKGALTALYG